MKLFVTKATTSKTMLVFIQDSSSTVGAGLTGLAWNTASLSWYYYREGAGTGGTQVTLATQTIGTWATGGFIELDATEMPGWYEIGVPNAALATGVDFVGMVLKGATNMAQVNIEIQLTGFDVNDGVRGGFTSLPNAAADAAGGLAISDAGGLDLDAQLAATNEVTAARMGALTDWIDGGRLDLLLDAIPTTAMRGTDSAALASVCTAARLAELDAANLPTDIDAILVDTGTTIPSTITTAQADLDILTGADGVNLLSATQASIDAIEADTNELQADGIPGLIAALNDPTTADIATAVLTTQMTEAYAADGTAPTLAQCQFMVWSGLSEFAISGTTITAKKLDGSTTAMTFTLDDGSNPTSRTRAT
jgi:hypothetical protein